MSPSRMHFWAAVPLAACLLAGCGWTPQAQVATLRSENRRLSELSRAQRAEIQNLKAHSRSIEDELLSAEEDLEIFAQQNGIDRGKLANLRREREQLRKFVLNGRGGQLPSTVNSQLASLAQRYPSLHFDAETGISKLDIDVLFDSGEAELKPAAQRMLQEFAYVMQDGAAQDLKVMVVGHTDDQRIKGRSTRHLYPDNWHLSTARALAVSSELRKSGLSGERMGVAGFASHQPIAANSGPGERQENRRVEIFVTSPEVPVVGMTETLTNLY